MNFAPALPESPKSVSAGMLARLTSLVAAASDAGAPVKAAARPYSFESECECPDDCLRDHENE